MLFFPINPVAEEAAGQSRLLNEHSSCPCCVSTSVVLADACEALKCAAPSKCVHEAGVTSCQCPDGYAKSNETGECKPVAKDSWLPALNGVRNQAMPMVNGLQKTAAAKTSPLQWDAGCKHPLPPLPNPLPRHCAAPGVRPRPCPLCASASRRLISSALSCLLRSSPPLQWLLWPRTGRGT